MAQLFKVIHFQTGQTVIGIWDEVCDYDKRVWQLTAIPPPQSHNPHLNDTLCFIKTYIPHNPDFYGVSGIFTVPIYGLGCLRRVQVTTEEIDYGG